MARVATPSAAAEIRDFLDIFGIRSTTAPCPTPWRRARAGGLLRHRWRLQVLVFHEDAARAHRLLLQWTLPVNTQ